MPKTPTVFLNQEQKLTALQQTIIEVLKQAKRPLSSDSIMREARRKFYAKHRHRVKGVTIDRRLRIMANELHVIRSTKDALGRISYTVKR